MDYAAAASPFHVVDAELLADPRLLLDFQRIAPLVVGRKPVGAESERQPAAFERLALRQRGIGHEGIGLITCAASQAGVS